MMILTASVLTPLSKVLSKYASEQMLERGYVVYSVHYRVHYRVQKTNRVLKSIIQLQEMSLDWINQHD